MGPTTPETHETVSCHACRRVHLVNPSTGFEGVETTRPCLGGGVPMSDDHGGAIFHAAKLLQLHEETESVEAVTTLAAALLAGRASDHVRQVAWFLPPELIQVLPKQHRARLVPLRPQPSSLAAAPGAGSPAAILSLRGAPSFARRDRV